MCGIVNISLNLLGAAERLWGWDKFDAPFDIGLHLGSERVLGKSTTWLGLALSLALGWLIYATCSPLGIVIGVGTFFGHALGSFIKRRFHYGDGSYLPVVDHGDYVILTGAILLVSGELGWVAYVLAIVLVLIVHPVFCLLGFKLGIRERVL